MNSRGDFDLRVDELLRLVADDNIDDERCDELALLLRERPDVIRGFVEYLWLDAELDWECRKLDQLQDLPATIEKAERSGNRTTNRFRWVAAAAVVVLIGCGFYFFAFQKRGNLPVDELTITLGQSNETVRITNVVGEGISASRGLAIQPGYSVRASGITPALIEYSDGTKLNLVGATEILFDRSNPAHFFLQHGAVLASVARRDANPLVINTVNAKLQAPRSEFALVASNDSTELRVTQGQAKLSQSDLNDSVVVPKGKRVVADGRSQLVLRDAPKLADSWEQDFEGGIPENWHAHFVTTNLPEGSLGAAKAQHVTKFGSHFQVGMKEPEFHGLFAFRDTTHLHVTYTAEVSKYINIFFITRPDRARAHELAMFKFMVTPGHIEPGKWRALTIPLSEFNAKWKDTDWTGPPPQPNEIPIWFWISSPEPDRGLVVDRIWITPDGPGLVRVEDVE